MKKTAAFLLIALVLFAAFGAAAQTAPFTFRNGIQWGMSPEEVQAAEAAEPAVSQEMDSGYLINLYTGAAVSNYSATLEYVFLKDALKLAVYDFTGNVAEKDFSYLSGALGSVYGEAEPIGPEAIYDVLNAIVPDAYDLNALTGCIHWPLDSATDIYMFYYTEDQFSIMYVSEDYATVHYNIFGL